MAKNCSHPGCTYPVFSKSLCRNHWLPKHGKPLFYHPKLKQTEDGKTAKPFRVIKKVSDKQAKLKAVYNIAASQFKKAKPACMARLHGCTGITSDVHHLFSGASRSKYYLDQTTWITVCVSCHHLIHDVMGKDQLISLGLKRIE